MVVLRGKRSQTTLKNRRGGIQTVVLNSQIQGPTQFTKISNLSYLYINVIAQIAKTTPQCNVVLKYFHQFVKIGYSTSIQRNSIKNVFS